MADKGQVELLLNGLPPDTRKPIVEAFRYVMSWFALGGQTKAENLAWYRVDSVTHTTANTEFSISHGMDHVPQKLIPFLDFNNIHSQIVPLVVSRAPDASRIYLTSASTGASFSVYLE